MTPKYEKPIPLQQKIIDDPAQFILVPKSRQIGISKTAALRALKRGIKKGIPAIFCATSERQAKRILSYVRRWARQIVDLAVEAKIPYSIVNEIIDEKKIRIHTLTLPNGAEICTTSANPDAIRGFVGDVYIDEAAFIGKLEELYDAAEPVTTHGYTLMLFSSENGTKTLFHKLRVRLEEKEMEGSLHLITLPQAVEGGLLEAVWGRAVNDDEKKQFLEKKKKRCRSPEAYAQEYMCEAIDEVTAFIPYKLIESVTRSNVEKNIREICASNPDAKLYLGVDIGRVNHPTAIILLEDCGTSLVLRSIEMLRGVEFSKQEEIIARYLSYPALRRCCIDKTGLGFHAAEDLEKRFGTWKVEGVTFNLSVKDSLAGMVLQHFQDATIEIPKDEGLRKDIHSITQVVSLNNKARYDVVGNDKDQHADRFWALALALSAAAVPNITVSYDGTPRHGEDDDLSNDPYYREAI